jgi:hypothetical protein
MKFIISIIASVLFAFAVPSVSSASEKEWTYVCTTEVDSSGEVYYYCVEQRVKKPHKHNRNWHQVASCYVEFPNTPRESEVCYYHWEKIHGKSR